MGDSFFYYFTLFGGERQEGERDRIVMGVLMGEIWYNGGKI